MRGRPSPEAGVGEGWEWRLLKRGYKKSLLLTLGYGGSEWTRGKITSWALDCEHGAEGRRRAQGQGFLGTLQWPDMRPAPTAPFGYALGQSEWGEAGSGRGPGQMWAIGGGGLVCWGPLSLTRGRAVWGEFSWKQRKETAGRGRGRALRGTRHCTRTHARRQALRGASAGPVHPYCCHRGSGTELSAPPPAGGEGAAAGAPFSPPSSPQRTLRYLPGTTLWALTPFWGRGGPWQDQGLQGKQPRAPEGRQTTLSLGFRGSPQGGALTLGSR